MRKSLLFAGVVAGAVVLSGVRTYADDASDIESFYPLNAYVQWDNTSGDYPVVQMIGSQPGTFGGHFFTGWSVLAADSTGSMDIFASSATLTTLTHNVSATISVGDAVNVAGQWGPFHQLPELSFSTVPASNNYYTTVSSGNATETAPIFTVHNITTAGSQLSNNLAMAGYYLEIVNATISGSTGSYSSVFPSYLSNIAAESYTITDNSGSMTMFDWTTSYSVCAAFGGSAVPTGPVNILGFASYNTGGPIEFTPLEIDVPEPSAFVLAGLGLAGLLAIRRRRS